MRCTLIQCMADPTPFGRICALEDQNSIVASILVDLPLQWSLPGLEWNQEEWILPNPKPCGRRLRRRKCKGLRRGVCQGHQNIQGGKTESMKRPPNVYCRSPEPQNEQLRQGHGDPLLLS